MPERGSVENDSSGRRVGDGAVEKDLGLGLLEGESKVNFSASLLGSDICKSPSGDLLCIYF